MTIRHILSRPFTHVKKRLRNIALDFYLSKRLRRHSFLTIETYDLKSISQSTLEFLESLRCGTDAHLYRYSISCSNPTLYASAYACMTHSMLGNLRSYSIEQTLHWKEYFDSFQNPSDGLFYDPVVFNEIYLESDWWGARHLALHMISAYTALGCKPKYPFTFLRKYYSAEAISDWFGHYDWSSVEIGNSDLDNKIMNIGCLLQYQRDVWQDKQAGLTLRVIKSILRSNLDDSTGMWGGFDVRNPHERSRMVQFAYHLFPIFFYDGDYDFLADKIVDIVLATQNSYGGFGVQINSSACEDMDSIDLLIRFYPYVNARLQSSIRHSLEKAVTWVLINQVDDGGFVFRLDEPFRYGSESTSSLSNDGAMLPTWFRTLSLAYVARFLGLDNSYVITRSPGYEF